MQTYIGTKQLRAKHMTRGEYNQLQNWTLPADQNGDDEGYLVEYLDGGKANHPDFTGYISWSPKDVFERTYRPIGAEPSPEDISLRIRALELSGGLPGGSAEQWVQDAKVLLNFIKGVNP